MGTNSAIPQIQLDELPTPAAAPVEFARQPEPQPDQSSAGWAGKGGQTANIAANFLHGWMEGRNVAAQRQMDEAKQKLHSSYSAYQMAMTTASNPDLPDNQRQAAAAMIPGLKGSYIDQVRAYSGKPPKGAKDSQGKDVPGAGEGQGFMHRLAKAFVAGKPEMFTSQMADMLKGSMPDAPPALSPQQQGARAQGTAQVATSKAAEAAANVSTAKAGQEQKVVDLQNQMATAQKQRDQLAKDPNADKNALAAIDADIQSMNSQIARYHGTAPPVAGQEQLAAAQVKEGQAALTARQQVYDEMAKGVDFFAIPENLRVQSGMWQPGKNPELDAYFSQIGPGKLFANQMAAMQEYDRNKRKLALLGRYPTPYVMMENDTTASLQHQLQDPDVAKKYGVAPLQADENVQEKYPWIVADETMKRFRAESDEKSKPRTEGERDRLRVYAIQNVLQKNPGMKDILSFTDAKDGVHYGVNPNYGPTGSLNPFGDNEKDASAKVLAAKTAVVGELRNLGVGDQDIQDMGFEIPKPMVNIPKPPQAMASTPGKAKTGAPAIPAAPAGAVQWEVTYPDKTVKRVTMTQDEVDKFFDEGRNPKSRGFQFQQISPTQSAKSQEMSATPAEKTKK